MTRTRRLLSIVAIVWLLASGQAAQSQNSVAEHFTGNSLSANWTVVAGLLSDFEVRDSKLFVLSTAGGAYSGPWQATMLRTGFEADGDFELSTSFHYQRTNYGLFDIYLLDTTEARKVQFRIWDSPSHWILVQSGPEWGTYCFSDLPTTYVPSEITITRRSDTVFVTWDGVEQWRCYIPDPIRAIQLEFAECYGGTVAGTWIDSIYANSVLDHQAPTAPVLDSPPLPDGKPIFQMLPTLTWQASSDPDQGDTVRYKLEISISPNFNFVLPVDSLLGTAWTVTDSLTFGTHYWWRVTAKDKTGLAAMSAVKDFWTWELGDVNHSHTVDLSDLSLLIGYLTQTPRPDISPKMVGDLTGDCRIDLSDLSLMVAYMTTSGVVLNVGCE